MSTQIDSSVTWSRFVIGDYRCEGPIVHLEYRFDGPDGHVMHFDETVDFGVVLEDTPQIRSVLRVLLIVAGTSYYKSIAPTMIEAPSLTAAERALLDGMYDGGLREFAYRNGIGVPLPVLVDERDSGDLASGEGAGGHTENSHGDGARSGVLIPVGGGKDSALVADLIPDGLLMAVNPTGAHEHLARSLGRPLLGVRRTLDPQLREIVARGAPNGHVPVTAINSAIAVALATSMGMEYVAMGLERSASEPTVEVDGVEVNHQFSKSALGEKLLADAFATSGVRYFSLLRPMTELAIGVAVAERGLASEIVSCNRAFTIWSENDASRNQRACGECAKCLFTALMLAPSLTPEQIRSQFGRDLLDTSEHIDPVRELWSSEKPFDCVGERHETAAALVLLAENPLWSAQVVPQALAEEARAVLADGGAKASDYLQIGPSHGLPREFAGLIDSLRRPDA